jgi:hypothetical protein
MLTPWYNMPSLTKKFPPAAPVLVEGEALAESKIRIVFDVCVAGETSRITVRRIQAQWDLATSTRTDELAERARRSIIVEIKRRLAEPPYSRRIHYLAWTDLTPVPERTTAPAIATAREPVPASPRWDPPCTCAESICHRHDAAQGPLW